MPHRLLASLRYLVVLIVVASSFAGGAPPAVVAQESPATATTDSAGMGPCPVPTAFSDAGVTVGLAATFAPGETISFGLPLPPGVVTDAGSLAVSVGGAPVTASVSVLLNELDPKGAAIGVRSVLVQIPASVVPGPCAEVAVAWQGGGVTVTDAPTPFAETSAASNETVDQADYTIEEQNGAATLVTSNRQDRVLFESREPAMMATFPSGYLAATGILGHQVAAADVGDDLAGLRFITESLTPFGLSAMYQESYPVNASFIVDPTDPDDGFEGWLYDRCATFLSFYVHTGDTRFLREGYRLCAYYADHIELNGENRGIFTGKADPDPKYSHLRGLYAYYALTGDETALEAGTAIAQRSLNDRDVVGPYRAGYIRALDHVWTERLLAVNLEALAYGHLLTGDVQYLTATAEMVATAHRHITGDAATLDQINPGAPAFPPQNCFIHTAAQAAEGDESDPWCSGWMPVLMLDPLLVYQDQTDDPRVDEIFVRLTRYLRDIGSAYFTNTTNNEDDTFLHPAVPTAEPDAEDQRLLVPLYGAGLDTSGQRQNSGEYDDFQHCLDATAITAVGLRALQRTGAFDQNPIGPFDSEGASFLALHQEFAACAAWTFQDGNRPHRDPATWSADDLAEGLANPAEFIEDNLIGNVSHNVAPQRKISWWFNTSLEQFALLLDAGVTIPTLQTPDIQPGDVPESPIPTPGPAVVATASPPPTPEIEATEEPSEDPSGDTGSSDPTPSGPVVTEGGAAADGEGQIVYTANDGTVWRIAAQAGATPESISAGLDTIATQSGAERGGGVSADGQWLVMLSERFDADCAGWNCLVVAAADLSAAEAVRINGEVIHPNAGAAIGNGGNLVVFVDIGGPHEYDLWATTRQSDGWSERVLLSGDSPYGYHAEPTISADGTHILFDCGDHQYQVDHTAICEVSADGSGFRTVVAPEAGPDGATAASALRHPAYAPDGSIVFSADWIGQAVWRIPAGGGDPEQVAPSLGANNVPCVLPDGRIASLWSSRPENTESVPELVVVTTDGAAYAMLVIDEAIADITCSA